MQKGQRDWIYTDPQKGTFTNFHTGECGLIHPGEPKDPGQKDPGQKERVIRINETAQRWFTAARTPILEYCSGRGLTEADIERFGLGYSADLTRRLTKEELLLAGLAKEDENGFRMVFRNRLMFPIRSPEGRIIAFGGRRLDQEKICKYLNTGETDAFRKRDNLYMYDIARRAECNSFILCEGYMDVIAMHKAGFINTVASLGTSLTQEQVRLLRNKPHIYIMYDSDEAGIRAAKRAIVMLGPMEVKVVRLDPYKDPDELFRKEGQRQMVERMKEAPSAAEFIRKTYRSGDDPGLVRYLFEGKERRKEGGNV